VPLQALCFCSASLVSLGHSFRWTPPDLTLLAATSMLSENETSIEALYIPLNGYRYTRLLRNSAAFIFWEITSEEALTGSRAAMAQRVGGGGAITALSITSLTMHIAILLCDNFYVTNVRVNA